MRRRFFMVLGALAVTLLVSVAPAIVAGQAPGTGMRTPWGEPDLQGVWFGTTPTPLERPLDESKVVIATDDSIEAAERIAQERARAYNAAEQRGKELAVGNSGHYNVGWQDSGKPVKGRASLIVDPANGRIPFTEAANAEKARREIEEPDGAAGPGGKGRNDNPEDKNLGERCLHWEQFIRGGSSQGYRIVQSPGYVAINSERLHENRIIPVDGRAPLPPDVRQWKGVSRGRWEGETLVVTTTNFTPAKEQRLGTSEKLRVTERFTRVDADTINYEATLEDPETFATPWTLALPLWKQQGAERTVGIYEYACHEGNTFAGGGMLGMLLGARTEEKATDAAKKGNTGSK